MRWWLSCCVLPAVLGQNNANLIPDPTNHYAVSGLSYFMPRRIRYSQTAEIYHPSTGKYWASYRDAVTETFSIHTVKDRGLNTQFELIDAGTLSNIPRNTRPRSPDLYDQGTQKFFLRFNESFILRSEDRNKYIGTLGTSWQSKLTLVDDINVAERFRMTPVRKNADPMYRYSQVATNININDNATYVNNGTDTHLLGLQLNYVNVHDSVQEVLISGDGREKKSAWGTDSDVFQIHIMKPLEG